MKIMCHEIRQKNSEHTYIETRSFDENSLKNIYNNNKNVFKCKSNNVLQKYIPFAAKLL